MPRGATQLPYIRYEAEAANMGSGASLLAAPNNAGWFVIHHGHRTPGDAASQPQLIASTRSEFTTSGGTEMAEQFARSLEQVSGVERNAEAIRRTRDRLEGNVAQ